MKSYLPSICLLFAFTLPSGAWQTAAPLTKQDVLARLRDAEAQHLSQADIAAEILQRGIAFAVDEKTLDQFRQAGARTFLLDAIKHAGKNVGKPQVSDPELDNADSGKPLLLLEQARRHALEFAEELPLSLKSSLAMCEHLRRRTGNSKTSLRSKSRIAWVRERSSSCFG